MPIAPSSEVGDLSAPYVLIRSYPYSIGSVMPDVVVEEIHHDTLVITQHPVMNGCPVSDHAYRMPPQLQMKIGFSASTIGKGGDSHIDESYKALINLQTSLQPFDVMTSKRGYSNMMIENIMVVTDIASFHVLNAVVTLKYVRRAGQAATQVSSIPQTTDPPTQGGEVQPKQTG